MDVIWKERSSSYFTETWTAFSRYCTWRNRDVSPNSVGPNYSWWLHGHRSFNVDNTTFCGTTYQQQYCNQQQSFRNLKDSQHKFLNPNSIMQLWKVRLKYWKFVDPWIQKNHEDPASCQKPPCATCFQHIHRNKCHNFSQNWLTASSSFSEFPRPMADSYTTERFQNKVSDRKSARLLQGQPKRPIRQGGCHYYVFQKRIEASKTAGHKVTSKASCCRPIWLYFFI